MRKYLLIFAVLGVAACEPDTNPRPWDEVLDGFMAEQGYTLDSTRETIYKNGYPLWYDERECYRNCTYRYLGPPELYAETKNDFIAAWSTARAKYVNEIASELGVKVESEPNVIK